MKGYPNDIPFNDLLGSFNLILPSSEVCFSATHCGRAGNTFPERSSEWKRLFVLGLGVLLCGPCSWIWVCCCRRPSPSLRFLSPSILLPPFIPKCHRSTKTLFHHPSLGLQKYHSQRVDLGGCSPKFVKCHPPTNHNTGKRKPSQNAQNPGVKLVMKEGLELKNRCFRSRNVVGERDSPRAASRSHRRIMNESPVEFPEPE